MTKPQSTATGNPPHDDHWEGPAPAPKDETGQHLDHWVLPEEERANGFVRPLRFKYKHEKCEAVTRMGQPIAETYARDPYYYGTTFCIACHDYFQVSEFTWDGTKERLGS